MGDYKFTLEPYRGMKSRYHCPSCRHREKTFVRYIDTETGECLHPNVGRCNRQDKCGYHYTPKQYFQDNPQGIRFSYSRSPKCQSEETTSKSIDYIPVETFKGSLQGYENNFFVNYLLNQFGVNATNDAVANYYIGSSKYRSGATVFWQIDINRKVRSGRIMLYNPNTGKRIKEGYNINWVHSVLKLPDFALEQCFFGEHLLVDNTRPVAIVESEKTAVIASLYFPKVIWLATGGLHNLNEIKCRILEGREVRLYPDLGAFKKWERKAKEVFKNVNYSISDLLEKKANEFEKKEGLDLADFLIIFKPADFQTQEPDSIKDPALSQRAVEVKGSNDFASTLNIIQPVKIVTDSWGIETEDLETYFKNIELPEGPILLDQCSTITDIPVFVDSHLATLKSNAGKRIFQPHLYRLQELKKIITIKNNNLCPTEKENQVTPPEGPRGPRTRLPLN